MMHVSRNGRAGLVEKDDDEWIIWTWDTKGRWRQYYRPTREQALKDMRAFLKGKKAGELDTCTGDMKYEYS